MDAPVKGLAPNSEKAKALQAALAQIEKQFGKGTIMRLGEGGLQGLGFFGVQGFDGGVHVFLQCDVGIMGQSVCLYSGSSPALMNARWWVAHGVRHLVNT